jgi:hypothetical protein
MSGRWSTVRRHDDEAAPGLDLSRVIVMGFLIAALLGMATGLGWMGFQFVRRQFGG